MRSLRSAAALLRAATDLDALTPLVAALGFETPPLTLDPAARASLGALPPCTDARVARGPGALRALLVAIDPTTDTIRTTVAQLADRLARRSPHLLWLIAAVEHHGPHTVIAAYDAAQPSRRTAALVVDRTRIVDSDADTLRALEAATTPHHDALTYTRRLDILGRDTLNRRFYRTLEQTVTTLASEATTRGHKPPAPLAARHEYALLYTCRLLFLAFLETKGWLDNDRAFLTRTFDNCVVRSGHVHDRVLRPLFFGTLNTPPRHRAPAARAFGHVPFLNGGLFAPAPVERRYPTLHFPDPPLGALFGNLLARYRFTAREDSTTWSEAAIDPEMLGRAFESLMADTTRHATGAFYTPHALVTHTTRASLTHTLAGPHLSPDDTAALLDGTLPLAADSPAATTIRNRLATIRILDPACGSGAFLVHALETLATLATTLGDPRPTATIRRATLTHSIFGIDINPTAVWLCELRLWLSVVIENPETDPRHVTPLPNLDRNVRVGDSLTTPDHTMPPHPSNTHVVDAPTVAPPHTIAHLRERYAHATGRRKLTLRLALDRAERARAIAIAESDLARVTALRTDLIAALRSRDLFGDRSTHPSRTDRARLATLRRDARTIRLRLRALHDGAALPFAFEIHFADATATGGFDTVIGNPPWVRLHAIPRTTRDRLRASFRVYRDAAWSAGAHRANAGTGFGGQIDLAALFIERSVTLCRPDGVVALLTPAKLLRSLAGGGLRQLLQHDTTLLTLDDWSDAPPSFDAAVYPALIVTRKQSPLTTDDTPQPPPNVAITVHHPRGPRHWSTPATTLPLDDSPGAVWLLLPDTVRDAFDTFAASGPPLANTRFGRPLLGLKCGCNDAFLVTTDSTTGDIARIRALGNTPTPRLGMIERAMLRPLLRGETLTPWHFTPTSPAEFVIWTHTRAGTPLPPTDLPPLARRWLTPWRHRLESRRDGNTRRAWWSLFRTDSATTRTPRVVWSDFGRAPRATVLPAGHPAVPLNSCYIVRCPELADAYALTAVLNSPLAAAWLHAISEPARGGFRRFLGWSVALLPLPHDWTYARRRLAPLAEAAALGDPPPPDTLWHATLDAYHLDPADVAPLAAWSLGPPAAVTPPGSTR